MPWDGSGNFTRVYNWTQDFANGIFVRCDRMDTDTGDIAAGISNCLAKDGQSLPIANLPMGGFKLFGLGNGAVSGESVHYGQVFLNPVFTNPGALADPVDGSNDQTLATTAWTRRNVTLASVYTGVNAINAYINF